MSAYKHTIKDMTLITVCASVLFVQQLALTVIPNVSLSTLLVVLYTRVLGFKRTTIIIIIHVFVSDILSPFGPVLPIYLPAKFIAWMVVPVLLTTVLRKAQSALSLSIFGLFFGFIYGWVFVPFSVFFLDVDFKAYIILDIPFEIVMGISNFITILWLYDILKNVLANQTEKYFSIKYE